jgi:hypothetical protein
MGYVDFEIFEPEAIEATEPQAWYMKLDHYTGVVLLWIAKKIWMVLVAIFKFVRKRLSKFYKSLMKDLGRMRRKFLEAFAEAIGRRIGWFVGILLIIAFTMSFTANGYSLSKTLSWDGIKTLWETFK